MTEAARTLDALPTPALVLDTARLDRNLERLAGRMNSLGVTLRPHMKTAKSIDVARRAFPDGPGPITVSTLAEADYFAGHGYRDMTYAVGIAPHTARMRWSFARPASTSRSCSTRWSRPKSSARPVVRRA